MAYAVASLFIHEHRAETMEDLFATLIKNVPTVYHEPFQITAMTLTGRIIDIQVHPNDTILKVKQEIYKQDIVNFIKSIEEKIGKEDTEKLFLYCLDYH